MTDEADRWLLESEPVRESDIEALEQWRRDSRRCRFVWGDWRCDLSIHDDDAHRLVWGGDDDEE